MFGRVRSTAAAGIVFAAIAASGCGDDSPGARDVDTDAAASPTTDLTAAGVGVMARGCGLTDVVGSGVSVELDDHVVTVAHTLAGAREVDVVRSDGSVRSADVIAFDADADLALLRVDSLDIDPLPLGIGRPQLGPATMVSWSRDDGVLAQRAEITRRLNISIEDIYIEHDVQRSGIEVDTDVVIGDSGGPIIDAHGDVVGIVYARSRQRDGIAFATDATEVRSLFDERPQHESRCR